MKVEYGKYHLIVPMEPACCLKEGIYLITGVGWSGLGVFSMFTVHGDKMRHLASTYEITQVNEKMMADALNEMEAYTLELNQTNTELKEQIGQDKTDLKATFNEIDRLRNVVRDLVNNDITHLVDRIEGLNAKLFDADEQIAKMRSTCRKCIRGQLEVM